jgi:histidinol-phosphatase (PHP family)
MIAYPDNHNHFIANDDPDGMLDAAVHAGVSEIAFTEHIYHVLEPRRASRYLATRWQPEGPPVSHAAYTDVIRRLQARSPVAVRVGIELDAYPDDSELETASAQYIDAHTSDWDIVIGSVHAINTGTGVGIPETEPVTVPAEAAWRDYTERLIAAAESGCYDVITHPVRLGMSLRDQPTPTIVASLLDELACRAARADVAIEVNGTDVARLPGLVALQIAAIGRFGTLVSLGSDAHSPAACGRVRPAITLLRDAGVTVAAQFTKRTRSVVALID